MHGKDSIFDLNENIEMASYTEDAESSDEDQPKRKPSLLKGIKQVYYEYCANTTIHCVQYFGDSRPLKEKIFWFCIFGVSINCCVNLIDSVYLKWTETPVIVSFAEKSTPVWSIPFPAVTICSETKRVLKTKGVTYARLYNNLEQHINEKQSFNLNNLTKSDLEEFYTLLQICNTHIIQKDLPLLSNYSINYFSVLNKMQPNFERYFLFCKWLRYYGPCGELFTQSYTEEGICYTFNGLSAADLYREDTYQYQYMALQNKTNKTLLRKDNLSWTLEDGYDKESSFDTYPARVLAAGERAGLFIALQSFKQEVDYACRGPIQGFKVLLHSPDDVPLVSKQYVRIPMGKEVLISVMPNMITTSRGIAEYHPMRRQCYLGSERRLRFFKTYTQSNCELECLANFTLHKCGCVKFSMPRGVHTPVCKENKIHCYDKAEDDLLMHEFNEGLEDTTLNYRGQTACNCLPACTSLVYNTEISQGSFDLEEMLAAAEDSSFLEAFPGSQMSRLSIYFKENQFITSKRSELYGITDFLANCGGIFGLFMGVSFLSMIELLYHFTLRLWSNMKRAAKIL